MTPRERVKRLQTQLRRQQAHLKGSKGPIKITGQELAEMLEGQKV